MTTREDIRKWLDEGVEKKASHVIIVVDTFDHGDYPVFVSPHQDVREVARKYNGQNMQRIMEVYNLNMDLEEQLNISRVFNY